MKDISNAKTSELLAELQELEKGAAIKPVSLECVYARQVKADRHSDICYELDNRCERAGLTEIGGFFAAKEVMKGSGDFEGYHTVLSPVCADLSLPIKTEEIRDLLTWILLKRGALNNCVAPALE